MVAKRYLDDSGSNLVQQSSEKRFRTQITFASVIGEAVMMDSLKKLCSAIEPMLRRVVHEELESSLKHCTHTITRSPSVKIQEIEQYSTLQLTFSKKLQLPIFTGSKIVDIDGEPLQILLVDTRDQFTTPISLPHSIKIELVVLDGDFQSNDSKINTWTSEEFEKNIVKERTGKRPLIAGDCLVLTVRDGFVSIGDLEFTDNSSWIRSRKFRIGARVTEGSYQGVKIREAMTEAFVVKDHRGELYKKHYPPTLGDEVWRLAKIGKDGAFHKKLSEKGINTVQDFLKLSVVDPQMLRGILGAGMSEKMWEVTITHARTCEMGTKVYVLRRNNCTITLNPICQVVSAVINGQTYSTRDITTINRSYIENLAREAYDEWHTLEEVVGVVCQTSNLLTQGDQMLDNGFQTQQMEMVKSYNQNAYANHGHRCVEPGIVPSNTQLIGHENWQITPSKFHAQPAGLSYSISDSSN